MLAKPGNFAMPLRERVNATRQLLGSWIGWVDPQTNEPTTYTAVCFSDDSKRILAATETRELLVWERSRPVARWGVAWLPEFWLAVVLNVLTVGSLVRDRRGMGNRR